MATGVRPFYALTGQEIKKVILKEIERQLDADYRFRENITYPLINWRWKLACNVYPGEPANWKVVVGPVNTLAEGAVMPQEDEPYVEVDFDGGRDVSAPARDGMTADATRRDAGLPVPSPRKAPGLGGDRMTVDVVPPIAGEREATFAATPEANSTANVEKGGRVFARSVTAKTAAAPEGVEVAVSGVSPTHSAEDMQKILEQEPPAAEPEAIPAPEKRKFFGRNK